MKHMPGLYRRKNGLYGFAKQVGGVRTVKSLGTRDLAEAIRLATEMSGSPLKPGSESVADLVAPYLLHKQQLKRYTAASVDSKRHVLNKFARFAQCRPDEVSRANVQAFYNAQRADGLSDDTAASYLATIRAFFRWCVDVRRLVRENPCAGLHLARVSQKARKNFCTPEQVDALIGDCPRDDLRFVLLCGFHAGMRKQEIIEAKAEWFDVRNRQIHLRKHVGIEFKDREERSLPMTDRLAEFLKHYGMREPYMLRPEVEKGKSIYRYDFDRPLQDYVKSKGLPWVTAHTMRHTFASLLASAGESIFNIAVWLGDDVRVVQKHYAKLLPVTRDLGIAFRAATPRPQSGSAKGAKRRGGKS
jgi:integrase